MKTRCWQCGKEHDRATGVDISGVKKNWRPKNGDVTLCISCGEWNVFDSKVEDRIRKPTPQEFFDIGLDPACRKVRWAWTQVRDEKRKKP